MASRARKPRRKRAASNAGLQVWVPEEGWKRWLLRATLFYLGFNLALNAVLAATRPLDLPGLFVLGSLDSRSRAAWMLSQHTLWHTSWLDEQSIPELLESAARRHRIDPALLQALVQQESGGKPHVISRVGACGLTQLMPSTAAWLGVKDPFDPLENLDAGARYLASLKRQFNGNVALALAAYNAGPGAVRKAGGIPPFDETRGYVRNITAHYQRLSGKRVSIPVQPTRSTSPGRPPEPVAQKAKAQDAAPKATPAPVPSSQPAPASVPAPSALVPPTSSSGKEKGPASTVDAQAPAQSPSSVPSRP